MRTVVLLVILISPFVAKADKLTEAVAQGQVTKQFLDGLTTNDVPKKWRTTLVDKSTDNHVSKVFSRETNMVLEVG